MLKPCLIADLPPARRRLRTPPNMTLLRPPPDAPELTQRTSGATRSTTIPSPDAPGHGSIIRVAVIITPYHKLSTSLQQSTIIIRAAVMSQRRLLTVRLWAWMLAFRSMTTRIMLIACFSSCHGKNLLTTATGGRS